MYLLSAREPKKVVRYTPYDHDRDLVSTSCQQIATQRQGTAYAVPVRRLVSYDDDTTLALTS